VSHQDSLVLCKQDSLVSHQDSLMLCKQDSLVSDQDSLVSDQDSLLAPLTRTSGPSLLDTIQTAFSVVLRLH